MPLFTAAQLQEVGDLIFAAAGCPAAEAHQVTEYLVNANLAGHDSHGVRHIASYVGRVLDGTIKAGAELKVLQDAPSFALLDADRAIGQAAAAKAMALAIEKASQCTISAVGIKNCNHIGRVGEYPLRAIERDMVGIALCNSSKAVAPFGGIQRMLGTNPIAIGIPTPEEPPFLLDFATSVSAAGKIGVRRSRGEQMPSGYIIDREGRPTTNPLDFANGALLPFGGPVGYKGFGLSLVVDILGGILTTAGAATSAEFKGGNGVFMIAVNIASFSPVADFKRRMGELIRNVKSSKPAPGAAEVLIPGEPEFRQRAERLKNGIYVEDATVQAIVDTAAKVGVREETVAIMGVTAGAPQVATGSAHTSRTRQ